MRCGDACGARGAVNRADHQPLITIDSPWGHGRCCWGGRCRGRGCCCCVAGRCCGGVVKQLLGLLRALELWALELVSGKCSHADDPLCRRPAACEVCGLIDWSVVSGGAAAHWRIDRRQADGGPALSLYAHIGAITHYAPAGTSCLVLEERVCILCGPCVCGLVELCEGWLLGAGLVDELSVVICRRDWRGKDIAAGGGEALGCFWAAAEEETALQLIERPLP
jgi:hypothetical protein